MFTLIPKINPSKESAVLNVASVAIMMRIVQFVDGVGVPTIRVRRTL